MSGVAGKSGRKRKSLSRSDAMRSLTLKLPGAIDLIGETMEGTNKDRLRYEAAIAIKEAVLGKSVQATSLDITGGEELSAGLVTQLFAMLAAKRKELETGIVVDPVQIDLTGTTAEGLQEESNTTGHATIEAVTPGTEPENTIIEGGTDEV